MAKHLASTYGDKAPDVAKLAGLTGRRWPVVGRRLVDEFPYIEAEIAYSVKEYAATVVDVLARRTRLAFLNVQAANEAIPRIADIMGKELGWTKERKQVNFFRLSFQIHRVQLCSYAERTGGSEGVFARNGLCGETGNT